MWTDFFTHCSKKRAERLALLVGGLLAGMFLLLSAPAARAEARIEQLSLVTMEPGTQLSVQMSFELPSPVDDALHRGIPLSFSAEANLYQERWYWVDKPLAKVQRYWRLSYQPLTRRYRLQVSPQPIESSGLGVGLAQTHDSLSDALSALQRVAGWTLTPFALEIDAKHRLEFRFRLDPNPLLKSWLSGASDQDWGLTLQRSQNFKAGARP